MNVQTRRQFVVRAGTVAASAILSPSALAAGLGSARTTNWRRVCMSGHPSRRSVAMVPA